MFSVVDVACVLPSVITLKCYIPNVAVLGGHPVLAVVTVYV
jgi:hypothetical protein